MHGSWHVVLCRLLHPRLDLAPHTALPHLPQLAPISMKSMLPTLKFWVDYAVIKVERRRASTEVLLSYLLQSANVFHTI